MRIALLVFVSACWTAAEPRPQAPPVFEPPAPAPRAPFPMHSRWEGTYRCSQGETAVMLTLDANKDGSLEAVFEFGPTPENPTVPTGSYKLRGIVRAGKEGSFDIALDPFEWLDQPDGYIMVSMSATSSRKWQRLVGRIDHPSCGEITVRRADER